MRPRLRNASCSTLANGFTVHGGQQLFVLVHLSGGFFLPNGFEFVLALLAMTTALVLAGPGRYALDAAIVARREPASEAHQQVRRAA